MRKVTLTVLIFMMQVFGVNLAGQQIVVDHTSLPLFDQIPEQYLQGARNLRILFMDRSVGVNTNTALNCLATSGTYQNAVTGCRRDYQFIGGSWVMTIRGDADVAAGLVDPYILFEPGAQYGRSNWNFYIFADTWINMASDFIAGLDNGAIPAREYPSNQSVSVDPMDYDVLSYQFSYLNVDTGNTIGEFFTERPGDFDDAYDLEREIAENLSPSRVFVYWTTSLARSIGTQVAADFNEQMRQWCRDRDLILFDFADIQSHDMDRTPCYDNRDGVAYTTPSGNDSENYPNDGLNIPAICQENTTEANGGHLGTAQGLVSVAKGFWILSARIAGWNPEGLPPAAPTNLRVVEE